MSKFDKRIKNLIKSTHTFISHRDLCLIRDYLLARLDEMEKPADFKEKMEEITSLWKQMEKAYDCVIDERIAAVAATSQAVRMKFLLPWFEDCCESYRNGIWQPNGSTLFPRLLNNAKNYQAKREEIDC